MPHFITANKVGTLIRAILQRLCFAIFCSNQRNGAHPYSNRPCRASCKLEYTRARLRSTSRRLVVNRRTQPTSTIGVQITARHDSKQPPKRTNSKINLISSWKVHLHGCPDYQQGKNSDSDVTDQLLHASHARAFPKLTERCAGTLAKIALLARIALRFV